eukprot:Sdes_comp13019_c0_seq2m3041
MADLKNTKKQPEYMEKVYQEMSLEESLELIASRTNPHLKWHNRATITSVFLLAITCALLIGVAVYAHYALTDMDDKTATILSLTNQLNYTVASNLSQMVNGSSAINQNIYFLCSALVLLDSKALSVIQWILGKLPASISGLLSAIEKALSLDPTLIPELFIPTISTTGKAYQNPCCPPGANCSEIYDQVLQNWNS